MDNKEKRKIVNRRYRERPEAKAYRESPENKAKEKAYRERPEVKARQQTPEYKARARARRQTPEFKARVKARQQTPEAKAKQKAYREIPEVKARIKTRKQTPEYKAKQKAYRETPEVKAKQQTPEYKARVKAREQTPEFKARAKKHKEKQKTNICLYCGKSKAFNQFCNPQCQHLYFTGENCPAWRGGISFEPYPLEWTRALRKQIRDRDNNKCMRCNKPREVLRRALAVHHIDKNKDNCNPINLLSLCTSCHGLTIGREHLFEKGFQRMLSKLYGYEYD